jgi:hypothetical protein
MTQIQHIEGFRRAPRASSPDATLFIIAALAGGALAVVASISPYVVAVFLLVGP